MGAEMRKAVEKWGRSKQLDESPALAHTLMTTTLRPSPSSVLICQRPPFLSLSHVQIPHHLPRSVLLARGLSNED